MRRHYSLIAILGLIVGWGSVSLGRCFAHFLTWYTAPVRVEPFRLSLGNLVTGENIPFTARLVNRSDQTFRLVRVDYSVCGCFFERQKLPVHVREMTLIALARMKAKEAVPHMLLLLNDTDKKVRETAKKALQKLGYQVREQNLPFGAIV